MADQSAAPNADSGAAFLAAALAARDAGQAPRQSPEEERRIILEAEALAQSEAGVPAKSARVVSGLQTKWLEFLDAHGAELGFDEEKTVAEEGLMSESGTRPPSALASCCCCYRAGL